MNHDPERSVPGRCAVAARARDGCTQDRAFDPSAAAARLRDHPIDDAQGALACQACCARQRAERPLVASGPIDVVASNRVHDLVPGPDKPRRFPERFRVQRRGGHAALSGIVSDETLPEHLRADPELGRGGVSGARREDAFVQALPDAGFHGVRIVDRDEVPWRTAEGIGFRSLTVEAFTGKQGPPARPGGWSTMRRLPAATAVRRAGARSEAMAGSTNGMPRGAR